MFTKRISLFIDNLFPDFIVREHPRLVEFFKSYLEYTERYNEVKVFTILAVQNGQYDPEQDGTLYQGSYIDLDYSADQEDQVLSLKGGLIKGSATNSIYQVEDVVYSILDDKWLLKAKPTNSTFFINGENIAQVDIGEYNRISNLIFYRDIDDTIEEFISLHQQEYLFGISTNISAEIRSLIKKIRQYYNSKGTEDSFKFLFRAIWDTEVDFYFPKVDILRASDGKWFQPYLITLDDNSNINDFKNQSIVGQTSGTRADVENVVTDFNNPITVPEFFTWENLTNVVEDTNGLLKTNSQGWNAYANSVETGLENFGLEVEVPIDSYRLSLNVYDPIETLSQGPGQTNGFTVATQNDQLLAYYNNIQQGGLFSSYVAGDILSIKEDDGSIKIFKNGTEVFTFAQTVPGNLSAKVVLLTSGAQALSNIRNTNRGSVISIPKFLEVTIKEGELLDGESITSIKSGGPSAVINNIVQTDGFWLNDDGKLSSNKVLQDNFYYQDFSYVLRTNISISIFEDIIRKINHPAGLLLFGEFVETEETIYCVNLSTFQENVQIRTETDILEVNLSIEEQISLLSQELFSQFYETSYGLLDNNKEDHPWDNLFPDISHFDNVDLSPFEDTPDEPAYLQPDSILIINN